MSSRPVTRSHKLTTISIPSEPNTLNPQSPSPLSMSADSEVDLNNLPSVPKTSHLPHLNRTSDSDSNSDLDDTHIALMSHSLAKSSFMPGSLKCPPIVHASHLSLADWDTVCIQMQNYLEYKDITDDQKVKRQYMACLVHERLQTWVAGNKDDLLKLKMVDNKDADIKPFLNALCRDVIGRDWAVDQTCAIFNTKQWRIPDSSFTDFCSSIIAMNRHLKGTAHHQSTEQLKHSSKDCTGISTLSVPYHELTTIDLARAREVYGKTKHPITLNALLSYAPGKAVTAVVPIEAIDNISDLVNDSYAEPMPNIGAIFGRRDISHFASGSSIFNRNQGRTGNEDTRRPAPASVAAVFPSDDDDNVSSDDGYSSPVNSRRTHARFDSPVHSPSPHSHHGGRRPEPVQTQENKENSSPQHFASPIRVSHLWWRANLPNLVSNDYTPHDLLLDDGSHLVLIRSDIVKSLSLHQHNLQHPEPFCSAFDSTTQSITQFVKIILHDPSNAWFSRTVRTLIVPTLCAPMILRLPFLTHNNLIVNYASRSVIHKPSGFDLLHPSDTLPVPPEIKLSPHQKCAIIKKEIKHQFQQKKEVIKELEHVFHHCPQLRRCPEPVKRIDAVVAVRKCIEALELLE
ncbi:hypothetical protein GYMLUDRAFT_253546 [Collybiopsis luxurians FD-317 M1]|uniref:Uncharacterized protein n=1 Tax=Collybiopsis luxurians FD-317 M1 TaxID=944289 RepID=A0A0D0BW69_9AGAR|nr:hypothetical protein GYMLUDRAFT_253546 [Collybiopsis luxurians FD-317 M1]